MARSPAYFALAAGVLLWCAALLTVPLAAAEGVSSSNGGYSFFSHICHQVDSRSLHLAGYQMPVCARCSAIYFAFFAGVLLSPLISRRVTFAPGWAWMIAITPMVLDVGADMLGIHPSSVLTRLGSGGLFGIVAALILTPLLVTACSDFFSHSGNFPDSSHEPKT